MCRLIGPVARVGVREALRPSRSTRATAGTTRWYELNGVHGGPLARKRAMPGNMYNHHDGIEVCVKDCNRDIKPIELSRRCMR